MRNIYIFIAFIFILFIQTNSKGQELAWVKKSDFGSVARYGAVGFSIGTKGYVGTGSNGTNLYNDLWEWNQSTNTWTQKANFPGTGRYGAIGFSIGTSGYIGTGTDSTKLPKKDFWEWNQTSNSWIARTNLPGTERGGAVGFSIGSKGYIATGNSGVDYLNDFWEWDPSTLTWTAKPTFPGVSRAGATSFVIGTKGYIGTGYQNLDYKNDFWEWDQVSGLWVQKQNFPGYDRAGAVGFSINSKGYIGNGIGPAGTFKDFWEWNPTLNNWVQKADFGGNILNCGAASFSIGSKAYVATGGNELGYTKNLFEFGINNGIYTSNLNNLSLNLDAKLAISFTTAGTFNSGNSFTAQLSDNNGNFTTPINIGSLTSILSGSINATIPTTIGSGQKYKIRVVSSNPVTIGSDNGEYINIKGYWSPKSSFINSVRFAAGFSIGTKAYIGTGYKSDGSMTNEFWEWNQENDIWTQKANFSGGLRHRATGLSINGKGYIGFGLSYEYTYEKDLWEWNPTLNTWTKKADLPSDARCNLSSFCIGTKGYICSGSILNGTKTDLWEWDQATNNWIQKSDYPGLGKVQAVGFAIGNKGYIGTGNNNGSSTSEKDFWEWDQTTNTWTSKATFPGTGRYGAVGFSISNKGFIGSGWIGGGTTGDFWEWNQSTNAWTQKSSSESLYGGVGFSIGNKGYLATGNSINAYFKELWEYYEPVIINLGDIKTSNFCIGTEFKINYTITGIFNQGNVFSAQLSDATGSFASPVVIGSTTTINSEIINCTIPNTTAGTGYKIRIVSSSPASSGSDNGVNLIISETPPGSTFATAIDIGTIVPCSLFVKTFNNNIDFCFKDNIGNKSDDIYYKFTLSSQSDVDITNIGSELSNTFLHLLNSSGTSITTSEKNPSATNKQASITTNLVAGQYYIVAEGYGNNTGNIRTQVSISSSNTIGASILNPIIVGNINTCNSYKDTRNNSTTNCYYNDYGQSSHDIYYQFYLDKSTQVEISHCLSDLSDTYLHLLDENGDLIKAVDDNGTLCTGLKASMDLFLNPGKYYVVSEGYSTNAGNITTQISIANLLEHPTLAFDGIDDYASMSNLNALNLGTGPFTFEVSIKGTYTGTIQSLFSKRSSTSDGFIFGIWGDGHVFAQLQGAPNIGYDQGPNVMDGVCHHVALSRDATGVLKFYVDGILTYSTPRAVSINSTQSILLGKDALSGLQFKGNMRDIRIWNTERTATQIEVTRNLRLNPQTGLVTNWILKDGGISQNITDYSGTTNLGIIGSSSSSDINDPAWICTSSCITYGNIKREGNIFPVFYDDSTKAQIKIINALEVQIQPNPFESNTALLLKSKSKEVKVTISTLLGSILKESNYSLSEKLEIGLGSELPVGVFVITVSDELSTQTIKVHKIR